MGCPKCRAALIQRNAEGEPILRNRGLVLKATGWVALCPRCRAEVPFSPDALRAVPLVLIRRQGGASNSTLR
jgi:hypothetical protein